jgi:hypothetical protein
MLFDPNWKKRPDPEISIEPWRQTLLAAADYIEEHGWCQGVMTAPDGSVCMLGAIVRCNSQDKLTAEAILVTHFRYSGVAARNDERGRTKEEVIAKLREVAKS